MRGERPVKYQTRFDFANPECDPDTFIVRMEYYCWVDGHMTKLVFDKFEPEEK